MWSLYLGGLSYVHGRVYGWGCGVKCYSFVYMYFECRAYECAYMYMYLRVLCLYTFISCSLAHKRRGCPSSGSGSGHKSSS